MTTRRCVRVQREVSSGVRDVKKGSEGRGGGSVSRAGERTWKRSCSHKFLFSNGNASWIGFLTYHNNNKNNRRKQRKNFTASTAWKESRHFLLSNSECINTSLQHTRLYSKVYVRITLTRYDLTKTASHHSNPFHLNFYATRCFGK